jgi:glycosyltransferase involved in cell wall biosynthesis
MSSASTASTSFDVIVTCYNYRNFVAEAVDSALAQTRSANRIIVIDDGSTDGSADLLRERYGNNSKVTLVLCPNGGQLAAFQRGSRMSDADVLCYLDADDRWTPDYLSKIGAIFDQRPDVDFVFSNVNLFGEKQGSIAFAKQPVDLGYTAICTYELAHWYGAPTSALSLRRKLALKTLDLPDHSTANWRISADNCLVFGASMLGGRKYFLPTDSVQYRIHGKNGWWSTRGPVETYQNHMRSRALITQYAQIAGITAHCLDYIKSELRTKPNPSWDEIKRYAKLSQRRNPTRFGKLRRALKFLSYSIKSRRQKSSEQ